MFAQKFLLFIAAIVAIHVKLHGQPFYFRHYEVESGLSNNAVTCSVQDQHGFMWFGTRDGINRFDGHNFKVYRFSNHYGNNNSGNNFIHALHIDASGSLLLATEKEIYRYHAQLDSFILLLSSKYFPIDEMVTDKKGNIWFNANNILNKFTQSTKQIKIYEPEQFFRASSVSVGKNGVLWASTGDGFLKKYNELNDNFTTFDLFAHADKGRIRNTNLIQCTGDDKILIGSDKAGFKIFDTKNDTYIDIPLCCEQLDNLFVRSFLQVSPTETWIGTETGIFIYNPQTGTSRKIQKNSSDQYALSDNVIYTLSKDREGGIWVGTYFGGINYYPNQLTPFQKYYYKPLQNSLSGNIVREIRKDQFGNLWIGTEDGGLNKLDAQTGKFVHFKPDGTPQSISHIGIHDLLVLENELWVGTFEHGLDILNIRTGNVVRHYDASSRNGLRSNFPFCLLKTPEGEIIVGTTVGIYAYNRDKDLFESIPGLPPYDLYTCILKDSYGTLWGGIPGKGVYFINAKTGASGNLRFDPSDATSISSDKVNYIFEDSKKNLWFATENGLSKWNAATRNFIRYDTQNGFPSNFLLAILEDEKGQLWISTTQGLVCLDPEKVKTQVYTTANGLLSDQFNFSSAFRDHEGTMYFGSAKGLISFQPSRFSQDSFVPPVYLTRLQINNQVVTIDHKESPLEQSISFTDKLTLRYDQSTFSLDFAALGYTAPQNLVYAYRLQGLSNNWTYVKNNRQANFTKLEPGTYVFSVKVSSSSGIWNGRETKLTIKILPPWWASRWAYATYFIAALLLIYYLFRNYHKRIEEKNRRKIELLEIAKEKEIMHLEIEKEKEIMQLEIAKEKEMLDSKLEFFTNVAHEIRTPLTLIKVPLATVMEKTAGTPIVENCLKIMEKNTSRLIELSNQLLDFRQTEIKGYSISLEKINISDHLRELHMNFTKLAEQNNIDMKIELPATPFYAFVDVDAFNKIMYNLFSNAVKYAATSVHVSLLPNYKAENTYTILVKNDGYLIPDHLAKKIFEPFYRIKETEAKKGTGIGLALARSLAQIHNGELRLEPPEGNRNVFSLTLPIHNNNTFNNTAGEIV